MLDSSQPREQAGFWSGYLTTDHIHVISQVLEKYAEYTKLLCMVFIDNEKTFVSVETSAVMKALRRQGVLEIYVNILEDIHTR